MKGIPLNVLPQDQQMADMLDATCKYSFYQAKAARKAGLILQAEMLERDYKIAKDELDKLREKKSEHDRIVAMVEDLRSKGINVTKIERVVLHVQ